MREKKILIVTDDAGESFLSAPSGLAGPGLRCHAANVYRLCERGERGTGDRAFASLRCPCR